MNLDGSGRETIVTGNLETRGVCVDTAGGRLYWVNRNDGKIMRCKLSDLPVSATDATKVQTLLFQSRCAPRPRARYPCGQTSTGSIPHQ
jgi:hypothetical protein